MKTAISLTLALRAPYALVWSVPVAGIPQRFLASAASLLDA